MVLAEINTQVLYGTNKKQQKKKQKRWFCTWVFCLVKLIHILTHILPVCDHDLTVNVKLIYKECSSKRDIW